MTFSQEKAQIEPSPLSAFSCLGKGNGGNPGAAFNDDSTGDTPRRRICSPFVSKLIPRHFPPLSVKGVEMRLGVLELLKSKGCLQS